MKKKTESQLKQPESKEYTPYARFSIALRGVDIIERKTGEKVYKYIAWERHRHDPEAIKKIIQRKGSGYLFVQHNRMKQKTTKP